MIEDSTEPEKLSEGSDTELLRLLRSGESEAYTELWRRHINAALRVAQSLVPDRAEDLASEAFLAVYHQVTISGKGPESSFRAYLFTTMRNTAIRWRKEVNLIDNDPDLEGINNVDALNALEERAESAEILKAFQSLPERWQRVLWLAEVEEAPRPEIAKEFGIKPNAVSALYRRARSGLSLQWLTQQVPADLREDRTHVAHLLPRLISENKIQQVSGDVAEHLHRCRICTELSQNITEAHERMSGGSLALAGFAGLGVVLPAASQLAFAATGVGTAAAAVLTLSGATLAASVGVFTVVGGFLPPVSAPSSGSTVVIDERESAEAGDHDRSHSTSRTLRPSEYPVGREISDPTIESSSFDTAAAPSYFYEYPERPTSIEPSAVPGPSGETDNTDWWHAPGDDAREDALTSGGPPEGDSGEGPNTEDPVTPSDADSSPGPQQRVDTTDVGNDSIPTGSEPLSPEHTEATPFDAQPDSGGTPRASTPAVPNPVRVSQPEGDAPGPQQSPVRSAGLTTSPSVQGFFAPVLRGSTAPGASVAIEVNFSPNGDTLNSRLFVVVSDASGNWSFDLRALRFEHEATYFYRLWAFQGTASSVSTRGMFTMEAPEVRGFEAFGNLGTPLSPSEAADTGVVFHVTGPAHGTVCLASVYPGSVIRISLDDQGEAVRRIRMITPGTYYFEFKVCEGQFRSPVGDALYFVDVEDPDDPIGWSPFGLLPEFEVTTVEVSGEGEIADEMVEDDTGSLTPDLEAEQDVGTAPLPEDESTDASWWRAP